MSYPRECLLLLGCFNSYINLVHTLRRMATKCKKDSTSDTDESDNEELPTPRYKKTRRINVDIVPKESGYLRVESKMWPKLEDDQRKFIQKYNSSIRHNEDITGLVPPDGMTIKQKARRRQEISDNEREEVESNSKEDESMTDQKDMKEEQPESKKQKIRRRQKKIRFPLLEEENHEE